MSVFLMWTGYLLLGVVLVMLVLGFVIVKETTVAVVYRLGQLHRILKPGPHLTIYGIDTLEFLPTTTIQMELPDEPEMVDRTDTPAPGKKKPHRVVHKGRREALFYVKKGWTKGSSEYPFDDSKRLDEMDKVLFDDLPKHIQEAIEIDPANAPLTPEWPAVIEWGLKENERETIEQTVKNFIRNVSPSDGGSRIHEVRKRANDIVVKIIQEVLTKVTVSHAISMIRPINEYFKEQMEIAVGEKENPKTGKKIESPWGIQITQAYFKEPELGVTVNKARSEAAAAESRKQDTIRQAEADAEATRRKADADAHATRVDGEAKRHAEEQKGIGEAARLKVVKEEMRDEAGQFAAALDVAETTIPATKPIIMVGEGSPMGAVFASLVGNFEKNK